MRPQITATFLYAVLAAFTPAAHCGPVELARGHGQEPVVIEDADSVHEAAVFVANKINEALASDEPSVLAYARFFGVEPQGPTMGFFDVVRRTFGNARPTLEVKNSSHWQVDQSGPYTQYGTRVIIRGSEFKSGILFIRIERIRRNGKTDLISVRPGAVFVSLF
jgi:hypothetical protein